MINFTAPGSVTAGAMVCIVVISPSANATVKLGGAAITPTITSVGGKTTIKFKTPKNAVNVYDIAIAVGMNIAVTAVAAAP